MSNVSVLVVGLGANLGPRQDTLRAAVRELRSLTSFPDGFHISSLYESEPLGPVQPRFLNAAVLFSTELAPLSLLDELQSIEARYGRVREVRWGPRTLDLDLLWIDGVTVDHPRLTVPHPELTRRPFALLPMLEVAPEASTGAIRWSTVLETLACDTLLRIAGPEWANPPPDP